MKNNTLLVCILSFVLLIAFQFLFSYLFYLVFPNKENVAFLVQLSIDLSFTIIILGLVNYWKLKLFNDFSIPNLKTLFFLISIAFLVVLIMPFFHLNYFLENLKDNITNLNIPSITNFSYNNYYEIFFNIRLFLIGPVLEELYYRRIIQKKLIENNYSAFTAILIASLLFSIGHIDLSSITLTFIGGVILGYTYFKTKNIFIAILLHIFINLFVVFTDRKVIDIDGINFLYLLIYPIAIFLIYSLLKRLGNLQKQVR